MQKPNQYRCVPPLRYLMVRSIVVDADKGKGTPLFVPLCFTCLNYHTMTRTILFATMMAIGLLMVATEGETMYPNMVGMLMMFAASAVMNNTSTASAEKGAKQ